jgi:hypothetical protein
MIIIRNWEEEDEDEEERRAQKEDEMSVYGLIVNSSQHITLAYR